jgi:nucleoside-diphosphate-sugar epimerase
MRGLWLHWSVRLGDGPLRLAPGVSAAAKGALAIKRIEAELGYQSRVTLADCLRRTYDWLQASQQD